MIKKIVDVKNPILRKKAKRVKTIDKKIKKIISDMKDTLYSHKDPEGVGLAAPQIGKSLQIFITDFEGNRLTIINPRVKKVGHAKKTKNPTKQLAGCLSLPHYDGPLARAKRITINYQNEKGKKQSHEFRGFMAQIMQHEIDHLNGVLFIDKLIEKKRPLYKLDGDEWKEVEL